ncbi:sulfurtransferase [Deminuibacter soli]|uniref:Sulfurtransferase n=1 Tax=Deminuibacter soli TaxID=2291815 RepID=A0A3E1NGM9_9BACT|nr:sulfurtransferase [Deminuibacter soli]RFM26984.1 sulfurtransferase [Deminuibacter soli]
MSPLIEIDQLPATGTHTILIDARGGKDACQRYLEGHLPNAVFADLDTHLAAHTDNPAQGGRHPLPTLAAFAAQLGRWGVTPGSHVIVYDDKSGANSAARLWWMLRAIGHDNVQVINGGLAAAKKAGIPLQNEAYTPTPAAPYPAEHDYLHTVTIEEVMQAAKDATRLVIDVRETPRYLGHTEPLDLIAGHIPGAINLPYIDNLDADGKFKPAEELLAAYDEAIGDVRDGNIIVHCGSGVTACHTLLGMEYAGISGPQLYIGSWSEWSRRDLPIGKEER